MKEGEGEKEEEGGLCVWVRRGGWSIGRKETGREGGSEGGREGEHVPSLPQAFEDFLVMVPDRLRYPGDRQRGRHVCMYIYICMCVCDVRYV